MGFGTKLTNQRSSIKNSERLLITHFNVVYQRKKMNDIENNVEEYPYEHIYQKMLQN